MEVAVDPPLLKHRYMKRSIGPDAYSGLPESMIEACRATPMRGSTMIVQSAMEFWESLFITNPLIREDGFLHRGEASALPFYTFLAGW